MEENNIVNPITEEIEEEVQAEENEIALDEPKELTEEEKRELLVQKLKESKKKYKPKKVYGVSYKQNRKRKNKLSKKSRKANR